MTHISDFQHQQASLSAERTDQELTWSRATPVAFDQLKAWFPKDLAGTRPAAGVPGRLDTHRRYRGVAKGLIIAMGVLNAIPLLFNFGGTFAFTAIGALALYLPAVFLDQADSE